MKISAQEEYGLRCLVQLARAPQGSLVTVKEIAKREALSPANVEKLLRLLAKGGLVHSLRGLKGGYVLNRPPELITLGQVVAALGQVPSTGHICQQFTGTQDACVHFSNCGIRSVWSSLTTSIQAFLERTTLASLLDDEYAVADRLARRLDGVSRIMTKESDHG
jgi:Rrf2 family protein